MDSPTPVKSITHWSDPQKPELIEATQKYNWSLTVSDSERGPVALTHPDGSEISLVNSTISGNYRVEYLPDDDATPGVTDMGTSWPELEHEVEWTTNIMKQHEHKN